MLAAEKPGSPIGTGLDEKLKGGGLDRVQRALPSRQIQDAAEFERLPSQAAKQPGGSLLQPGAAVQRECKRLQPAPHRGGRLPSNDNLVQLFPGFVQEDPEPDTTLSREFHPPQHAGEYRSGTGAIKFEDREPSLPGR